MNQTRQFPVAIHKDPNSVYGVSIPDIPGCFSCGDTIEDAIANIKDAAESHIELLFDNGAPTDFSATDVCTLKQNKDWTDAELMLIEIKFPIN